MTRSAGEGPLSWSVQSAVDMRAATASCGCPSLRLQWQVRLADEGWGRLRSCLPGERMCTRLHPFVLAVNHAATPLFSAIAAIGPPGLLRRVWAVGRPATAEPASTRSPAVAARNRTGTGGR